MTPERLAAIEERLREFDPELDAATRERMLRAVDPRIEAALRQIARGGHFHEEFPDTPSHWAERFDCRNCDAYGEDRDHMDRRHEAGCPTRLAREALSPTETPAGASTPRLSAGACARCHGDGHPECRCSPHDGMSSALPTRNGPNTPTPPR